jgi:hypothetical protein
MKMASDKACRFCLSETRSSMWTRCFLRDLGQKMKVSDRMPKTTSVLSYSKSIEASVSTGHMSLSKVLRVTTTTCGS